MLFLREVLFFGIYSLCHEFMNSVLLEVTIGKTTVTSDISGCREVVDGENGWRCKVKNAEVQILYGRMKKSWMHP